METAQIENNAKPVFGKPVEQLSLPLEFDGSKSELRFGKHMQPLGKRNTD